MGFFSKLFSKETCELCAKEVGALARIKLKDGKYICKDCRKNTSAFYKPEKYTLEEVKKHIEYMKKQDELYHKEFETLSKDERERFVHLGYYGLEFADKIGMFEVITPEANKRNYKELFRYDQIKDFEIYGKENMSTEQNAKKYSETGIKLIMRCSDSIDSTGSSEEELKRMHPYASEIIIPVAKDVDNLDGGLAKHHLNRIFGRAEETLAGAIKEKFTGTEHERTGYKAGNEALGALGSFVKGKVTGNEEDLEAAKEKMKNAASTAMDYMSENRTKYAKIADEVEVRTLGKTLREFLYEE